MKKNKIIVLLILCCLCSTVRSQNTTVNRTDSIRLSLLTCAPGNEIYSLFGHTAIRYENPIRGIDVVFNYGMFSFNTPNFILRFALGETDYELGVTDYQRFAGEYDYFGRSVWQQTLNLTPKEKEKLIALLEENYRPENRTYRYNFFYDNCATRPRDKIEESLSGKVLYTNNLVPKGGTISFRDIIHRYAKGHPWARFGMDFCIGSEADRPITDRQTMYAPFFLMDFFATARVTDGKEERMLVADTEKVVDASPIVYDTSLYPTPLQAALILFILTAAITIYGLRKKRGLWGVDLILFSVAGIAGCVIAFLALFSEHPAVSANYLLWVFHPGQLIFLPFIINAVRKGRRSWYHVVNFAVLTFFIVLFSLIPQRIDFAVVPLALCLLIRSASNLILTYKKQ